MRVGSAEQAHVRLALPKARSRLRDESLHVVGQVDHAIVRLDVGLVEQRPAIRREAYRLEMHERVSHEIRRGAFFRELSAAFFRHDQCRRPTSNAVAELTKGRECKASVSLASPVFGYVMGSHAADCSKEEHSQSVGYPSGQAVGGKDPEV